MSLRTWQACFSSSARTACLLMGFAAGIVAVAAQARADEKPAEDAKAAEEKPIVVHVVDRAGYEKVLAEHRGKFVLVDFWAIWCLPCHKQLPHSAELQQKYADDLVVVTMSMDDPELRDQVRDKLASIKARTLNLMDAAGGADESFEGYEIDNSALPHYKLYDRRGKLLHKFVSGDFTGEALSPSDVDKKLEGLIGKASSSK